ncbi:MAG: hypothetical protein HYY44_00875 [Deltaproteobacteria bacterium]|nr:hypothetical protein [Deltaproteobacteria bacterium]
MIVLSAGSLEAASYRSTLKKWTQQGKDYVFNNLEMRLDWRATYFSDEFRAARLQKLASLLEWTDEEKIEEEKKDREAAFGYDEFFIAVYAGSNVYPDIGKESGQWRIGLEIGGKTVMAEYIDRAKVTELERKLYPYLDHWSNAYRVRFPRTIHPNEPFSLKMMGIPATSELHFK